MNQVQIGDPLHRYAAVNDILLDTYGQKCLDASYKSLIDQLTSVSWNDTASEGGKNFKLFIKIIFIIL
jgi:hypothetical protein